MTKEDHQAKAKMYIGLEHGLAPFELKSVLTNAQAACLLTQGRE